jgi:hypothetical protein
MASSGQKGKVAIHSDCIRALKRVSKLCGSKVSAKCPHADILKVITISMQHIQFVVSSHMLRHTMMTQLSGTCSLTPDN